LLLFTVPAHVTTLVELLKRDHRRIHPVAHVSDPHVPGEETGRTLMPNGVYTHEITCKWVEPTGQKGVVLLVRRGSFSLTPSVMNPAPPSIRDTPCSCISPRR